MSEEGKTLAELDVKPGDVVKLDAGGQAALDRRRGQDFVASLVARGVAVKLVVTGPPGPHNVANAGYARELDELRRSLGVSRAAVFLYLERDGRGRPLRASDRVMADLYALSDALLFPSKQEGFGIPLIEAGLARAAIFCSDIPPSREAAGDDAHYFALEASPHDVADMIEAWMRSDSAYRMRQRVLRAYTWQAVYTRYIEPLLTSVVCEATQAATADGSPTLDEKGGARRHG